MSRRRYSILEMTCVAQNQAKEQEESLSHEIDQNLRTLALLQPLNDTAKPLIVKDAFVKPNKTAFIHVFHYLVHLIIGAVGYRKRFRWPISTSKDESDFRTAAVDYLNDCHKNFKWPVGPFKMHTVLFPGGVEFMKMLVELSKTAMHMVLRDHDSLRLLHSDGISLCEAKARLQAAEEAFAEFDAFRSKIRDLSTDTKQRTCRLREMMHSVLSNTSITEQMMDQGFLSDWEAKQHEEIDTEIMPEIQRLESFLIKCSSFEQKVTATKPQQLCFDKEKMNTLGLLKLSEHFDPHIDHDKLFTWFIGAMPELINALYFKPPRSLSRLENESQLLDRYLRRAHELSIRIDMIALQLPAQEASTFKKSEVAHGAKVNNWYENLMVTPKMKGAEKKDFRVNIWDAIPAMDSPVRKMPLNVTTSSDDTSGFSDDITFIPINSMKLDPMSMLNTAIQRNKGFNKSKSSPKRNAIALSPSSRLNNMFGFNSTMLPKEDQLKSPMAKTNTTRSGFIPLRRNLF